MSAEMNQHIYETCMDLLGADALTYEMGYERKRPDGLRLSGGVGTKYSFLRARANTIEGGTSEVMNDLVARWHLGL